MTREIAKQFNKNIVFIQELKWLYSAQLIRNLTS